MRYTGPSRKLSRHVGVSLHERDPKDLKRNFIPGQHGGPSARRKKVSEYGKQLIEKQKLRHMYGVNERQFRRMFMIALASKEVTGFAFMKLLESRLDNLLYRFNFARSRAAARQMVNHGHVLVNGKSVKIPSYLCKIGDVISFKDNTSDKLRKLVTETLENLGNLQCGWVEVEKDKLNGKYLREPERSELTTEINEAQIVEYYNRKL